MTDEQLAKLQELLNGVDTANQIIDYVQFLFLEKSAKETHFEEVKQRLADKENVVISVDGDDILYTAGNDVFGVSVETVKAAPVKEVLNV